MGKIMEGSYPPDHPEQVLKQGPALLRRVGKVRPVFTVVPGVAGVDDLWVPKTSVPLGGLLIFVDQAP
jgi:hypothetical protein